MEGKGQKKTCCVTVRVRNSYLVVTVKLWNSYSLLKQSQKRCEEACLQKVHRNMQA